MAGDGIRITAALREKFNAYVGAEVLTKADEGLTLTDVGNMETGGLDKAGDGVISIQYPRGLAKIIDIDGYVTLFCGRDWPLSSKSPCGLYNSYKTLAAKRGGKIIKIAPRKMTLAVIGLFGSLAIPNRDFQKMNPTHIRSAHLYFQEFTQPPPVTTDPYDGPSGQEGDCR